MSKLKEEELLEKLKNWREEKYSTFYSQWNDNDELAYQQIVELIKIFFAKEISEGIIKEDIPQADLIEWLQGLNQAATAVKDYYVMKATTQLIEMLRNYDMVQEYLNGMDKDWLPTPENINALPEPVRKYIADLETNADPPSMVQENALLRDTCKALEIKLEERVQVHDELLIKYTEKLREDYERGFCSRNNYKGRLKQFSQEAGLEIVTK